jgi:hypothetical protein
VHNVINLKWMKHGFICATIRSGKLEMVQAFSLPQYYQVQKWIEDGSAAQQSGQSERM